MSIRFVTGTDTGVGKTVCTAALAAATMASGRRPFVFKPAQTGVDDGEPTDLEHVRRLAGPVAGAEGIRLLAPLAPASAARLEGAELPPLLEQRDRILGQADELDVLVEGAGGVLVELGDRWNLIDLAESVTGVGMPVSFVVVARAGLGTLNHAALTVQAIQRRGLAVEGIVIGAWPDEPGLAEEQNLLDLPLYTGLPVLARIPEGAGRWEETRFREWARTQHLV